MSAYILNQEDLNILTRATDAALRLNQQYPGSYGLSTATVEILGKYAGNLHNVYRALYITNTKAVNGRYNDNQQTIPKYKNLHEIDIDRINPDEIKKACKRYGCYMYQIAEDPIYGTPIYNAFSDIYRLLCMIYFSKTNRWSED